MIALLSFSNNLLAQTENKLSLPSTGGSDSVLVSYDDLRIANSKMIQLKYEEAINKNLIEIISNDSIVINNYQYSIATTKKKLKKVKRERNIFAGSTFISIFALIITLM